MTEESKKNLQAGMTAAASKADATATAWTESPMAREGVELQVQMQ
jgi:hypothetical protein